MMPASDRARTMLAIAPPWAPTMSRACRTFWTCSKKSTRPAHNDSSSSGRLDSTRTRLMTSSAACSFSRARRSVQRCRKTTKRGAKVSSTRPWCRAIASEISGPTWKSMSRCQRSPSIRRSWYGWLGSTPESLPARHKCRVRPFFAQSNTAGRSSVRGTSRTCSVGKPRLASSCVWSEEWTTSFVDEFRSWSSTVHAGGRKSKSECWYPIPGGTRMLGRTSRSWSTTCVGSWSQNCSCKQLSGQSLCKYWPWLAFAAKVTLIVLHLLCMLTHPPSRGASSAFRLLAGSVTK
mmetsp:Transcript_64675/g.152025  ORF Transcript_64675/g.152025 Transcript_64675/m.152025 type:complete len:291 (+) Transcript_64675:226-1098(+)